jgi:hypothetical protein
MLQRMINISALNFFNDQSLAFIKTKKEAIMKNLILRFDYQSLRNETHVECQETCDGVIVRFDPDKLGIRPVYDRYRPLLDAEVSALDIKFDMEAYNGSLKQ